MNNDNERFKLSQDAIDKLDNIFKEYFFKVMEIYHSENMPNNDEGLVVNMHYNILSHLVLSVFLNLSNPNHLVHALTCHYMDFMSVFAQIIQKTTEKYALKQINEDKKLND